MESAMLLSRTHAACDHSQSVNPPVIELFNPSRIQKPHKRREDLDISTLEASYQLPQQTGYFVIVPADVRSTRLSLFDLISNDELTDFAVKSVRDYDFRSECIEEIASFLDP